MTVDFSYVLDGLDMLLKNLSEGYDTCEWKVYNEGAEIESGTDPEEFAFIATDPGFYKITLAITQGVTVLTKGVEVYLNETGDPSLLYSILRQVDFIYPGILETYWESAESYKIKWQETLVRGLNSKMETPLPEDSTHDESQWPYLWNVLIAQLIARDIFLDIQTTLSGVNPGSAASGAPIKKITTGPVDTEWQNTGSVLDSIFKPDGLFDELNKRICALARVVGVLLTFCTADPFFPVKITPETDVKNVNKLLKYGSSYILTTFYN